VECKHVNLGNGVTAIICGSRQPRRRCKACGHGADRECDFPLSGAKEGQTCDVPICPRCTSRPLPDTDLCPAHQRYLGMMHEAAQKAVMDTMRRASEKRGAKLEK
jgi:hypothetical protein